MIESAKGPMTILFDSVTPISNAATAKDCINFLQVLGAKIKNAGGIFIFTATRSEEHTSELQSPCNLVCRLLLEKKKIAYELAIVTYNPTLVFARCTHAFAVMRSVVVDLWSAYIVFLLYFWHQQVTLWTE